MNAVEIPERALAALCSCELDRALAGGTDPASDSLLARRADQLSTDHVRRTLAADLRAAIVSAERPRRFSGPSPAAAAAIRGQRSRLERLVARLESGEPAGLRGVAAVAVLVEDSESPLWNGRRATDLVAEVNCALNGIED